jgi:defect-in-organelle-trafficking protein DotC
MIRFPHKCFDRITFSLNACGIELSVSTASNRSCESAGNRTTALSLPSASSVNHGRSAPPSRCRRTAVAALATLALFATAAHAQPPEPVPPPPTVEAYLDPPSPPSTLAKGPPIRAQAFTAAAFGYGVRAGLARRTWELQQGIESHGATLDATYRFSALLITGPAGKPVEPPIVYSATEGLAHFEDAGQAAGFATEYYRTTADARLASNPRDWRTYIVRDFSTVTPPDALLYPSTSDERDIWRHNVAEGWTEGVRQAEETFEEDIDRLTADYIGMLTARRLIDLGMMSAPFVTATDRGVTGDGREMRIGDVEVRINAPALLEHRTTHWRPPPVTAPGETGPTRPHR